jgi:hypothetical protein
MIIHGGKGSSKIGTGQLSVSGWLPHLTLLVSSSKDIYEPALAQSGKFLKNYQSLTQKRMYVFTSRV